MNHISPICPFIPEFDQCIPPEPLQSYSEALETCFATVDYRYSAEALAALELGKPQKMVFEPVEANGSGAGSSLPGYEFLKFEWWGRASLLEKGIGVLATPVATALLVSSSVLALGGCTVRTEERSRRHQDEPETLPYLPLTLASEPVIVEKPLFPPALEGGEAMLRIQFKSGKADERQLKRIKDFLDAWQSDGRPKLSAEDTELMSAFKDVFPGGGELKYLEKLAAELNGDFDLSTLELQGRSVESARDEIRSIKLQLEAHTDSDGNPKSNQELSERRAEAVKMALVLFGVEESRITAVGKGESEPFALETGPAAILRGAKGANRRVVIKAVSP